MYLCYFNASNNATKLKKKNLFFMYKQIDLNSVTTFGDSNVHHCIMHFYPSQSALIMHYAKAKQKKNILKYGYSDYDTNSAGVQYKVFPYGWYSHYIHLKTHSL